MRPFFPTTCLALALLSSAAAAAPQVTILHSFAGQDSNPPAGPAGGLLPGPKGSFYGVTAYGGDPQYGTVFQLKKSRAGWTTNILHAFGTQTGDGIRPQSDISMDSNGTLYGTTTVGGAYSGGTVYAVSPPVRTGGAWSEATLHDFGNGSDGQYSVSGVTIGPNGVLYGMTSWGGTGGPEEGIVYALAPSKAPGGQWTETVLHDFTGSLTGPSSDGAWPIGDLLLASDGSLYGTTFYGGSGSCPYTCGTVFRLAPPRHAGGSWTESIIYNFKGQPGDGMNPHSGVVADSKGVLYGTTYNGGPYNDCIIGCGTVYKLVPPKHKGGAWTETVIQEFTSDNFLLGLNPMAPPLPGPRGVLFGTTQNGGAQSDYCEIYCGVLFELVPKNGAWSEKVLHNFMGPKQDGQFPQTPLLLMPDGSLYATTAGGGVHSGGTAFKFTK